MFEGISFKVAEGTERLLAVEHRRAIYELELGHHGVDEFDERAHQLVAVDSTGQLLAGLRILSPDQRPLEIEQFVDLSVFLAEGRAPGQIGGLWIRPEERRISNRLLLPMGMLKLAYAFARKHLITDLVMRTHILQLRHFYRRAFFQPLDHLGFDHPLWGHVYVMHLDVVALESQEFRSNDPLVRFLVAADPENIQV